MVAAKELRECERIEPHDLEPVWGVRLSDLARYGQPVVVGDLGDCLELGRNDEAAIVRRVYPLCDRRFDCMGFYAVPLDQVRKVEQTIVRLRLSGDADNNWVVRRGNPDDHCVVPRSKLCEFALKRAKAQWPLDYQRVSARWE